MMYAVEGQADLQESLALRSVQHIVSEQGAPLCATCTAISDLPQLVSLLCALQAG